MLHSVTHQEGKVVPLFHDFLGVSQSSLDQNAEVGILILFILN